MNFSRVLRETDTFHCTGGVKWACAEVIFLPKPRLPMAKILAILLVALCIWRAPEVLGHQTTDSYLALSLTNKQIEGRWAISLRDLDHVLTIDEDKDGEVSEAELLTGRSKIEKYAFDRLKIVVDSKAVEPQAAGFEIEEHSDAVYVALLFQLKPEIVGSDYVITYALFNDADPLHRGLFRFDLP